LDSESVGETTLWRAAQRFVMSSTRVESHAAIQSQNPIMNAATHGTQSHGNFNVTERSVEALQKPLWARKDRA
jgi:hypothetical protein